MDSNGKQFQLDDAHVDILVYGFPGKSVCHGSLGFSTIELVRTNTKIALIDVGAFSQHKLILESLAARNLTPADTFAL
jgi:hypothetical protein